LTIDEVEELKLLSKGKLSSEAKKRTGTHVAFAPGRALFVFDPNLKSNSYGMVGMHGGLLTEEVLIPLVVI